MKLTPKLEKRIRKTITSEGAMSFVRDITGIANKGQRALKNGDAVAMHELGLDACEVIDQNFGKNISSHLFDGKNVFLLEENSDCSRLESAIIILWPFAKDTLIEHRDFIDSIIKELDVSVQV